MVHFEKIALFFDLFTISRLRKHSLNGETSPYDSYMGVHSPQPLPGELKRVAIYTAFQMTKPNLILKISWMCCYFIFLVEVIICCSSCQGFLNIQISNAFACVLPTATIWQNGEKKQLIESNSYQRVRQWLAITVAVFLRTNPIYGFSCRYTLVNFCWWYLLSWASKTIKSVWPWFLWFHSLPALPHNRLLEVQNTPSYCFGKTNHRANHQ